MFGVLPGGVISLDLEIPELILSEGEHTLESHFALVNYQVGQSERDTWHPLE